MAVEGAAVAVAVAEEEEVAVGAVGAVAVAVAEEGSGEAAVVLAEEAAAVEPLPCCSGNCSCTVAPAGKNWTQMF